MSHRCRGVIFPPNRSHHDEPDTHEKRRQGYGEQLRASPFGEQGEGISGLRELENELDDPKPMSG